MARHVRNSRLDSRTSREKLKPSGKPVYCGLGNKLHLGYRKGKSGGGKWVLRRYLGDEKYVTETIAEADDLAYADGVRVLDYRQAQDAVRKRMEAVAEEERIASFGPPLTVAGAIESYVEMREARCAQYGGGPKRDAFNRLSKHVLADGKLAETPLAALTVDRLATWRERAGERTVHDFKASLNAAARRHRDKLPPSLRDVIRDGLASARAAPPAAREAQALPDADVRRLVAAAWKVDEENGWRGDLGRLVVALAATGARFSQLVRMHVSDVQAREKRLMIPTSRKGAGGKSLSHIGVPVSADVLAALAPAVAGRMGHEPLFLRPRWRPVAGEIGLWERADERVPWVSSHELQRPWRLIVAKAAMAAGTVPYCLRHSSVVRMLRQGLPVQLVARVHDTSALMLEKNYALHIASALDDLVAGAAISLSPATVTPIAAVRE
jgi:integrase